MAEPLDFGERCRGWQCECVIHAPSGARGGAAGSVEELAGDASTLGAEAGRRVEAAPHRGGDRAGFADDFGRRPQQRRLVGVDVRFPEQFGTVDDDHRTVEQRELEPDRAVVGHQRVGDEQIGRRVNVDGEMYSSIAAQRLEPPSPVHAPGAALAVLHGPRPS